MDRSRLLLLAQLFCIIALINAANIQRIEQTHREKRQSPLDLFDTLYNQARAGTATLYNTLGGLSSVLPRIGESSGDSGTTAVNPLSVLTEGVSSVLTPVLLTGLAAGQDARRILQQGEDVGTNVLRTGIGAANEGSKTASTILGTSIDGVRNLTDLGGNIFRSFLPNIGSSSSSDLNKSGSNPVSSFMQTISNSFTTFLRNLVSDTSRLLSSFSPNRSALFPDTDKSGSNPFSAFRQNGLLPGNAKNVNQDSSSESKFDRTLKMLTGRFMPGLDPFAAVVPNREKNENDNSLVPSEAGN